MLIKEFFSSLAHIIDQISTRLPTKNEAEQKQIEEQVKQIKSISDQVLEEWIQFEELMSKKIGNHFPDMFLKSTYQDFKNFTESAPSSLQEQSEIIADRGSELFYKAKGYFDLGLYETSFSLLKDVIQEEPDHEFARLYFAYSALFTNAKEDAIYHFQLLLNSCTTSKIRAVCNNALGILHFDEMQYEKAIRYFQQAIHEDDALHVALYNLGMTYYMEGEYKLAIQKWEQYLSETKDQDLELIFYLSNSYLRLGQYKLAMDIVQTMVPPNHEQILMLLGKFYEDAKQYDEAIQCYRNILMQNPQHSEAIHGIGWNLWLKDNLNTRSITILKKALCLDRNNANILFSIAWIYFHQKQIDKAEQANHYVLQLEENSPLAFTLSFLIALQKGDQEQATKQIEFLQEQKDNRSRALGSLLMGKLKLKQERLHEAIESFKRSIRNNPHLKESYLLQGIAYFLNKENEKATKLLKMQQMVSPIQ